MKSTERISIYRVLPCIAIVFSALLTAAILCYWNQLQFDEIFCVGIVALGILPVFIFEMSYERRRELIGNNIQTKYERIALGFFLCCVLMLGISFLPEFFRPVMFFPLIMMAFSNANLGFMAGMFLNILLTLTTGGSYQELLAYSIMITIAGVLGKSLKHKEYRVYIGMLLFFVNLLFTCVFYYWANERIEILQFGYAAAIGLVIALYGIFLFPKNEKKTEEETVYFYEHLLQDDAKLLLAIKDYSPAEYRHARKVSDIAYKYAKSLGLKPDLAATAGLYYRLGRLEGEPLVENGVLLAEKHCFPLDVIEILKEYGGEKQLPSTPESALVHMIDAVSLKIELLDKQVGSSQWNREVLIYQTLNEYSSAGLYDKSGLSINAFIKIRELLSKEELL